MFSPIEEHFFQAGKAVTIKMKVDRFRMENNPFQGEQECEEFGLEQCIHISIPESPPICHNTVYKDIEGLRQSCLRT